MPTLVLLRHGESAWNSRNLFTGWVDVDLTARGEEQARHSGRRLREAGLLPDVLHTSVLTRAIRTGALAMERRSGTGSPRAGTGGSTSAATGRCRVWTGRPSGSGTARSSSRSGGARTRATPPPLLPERVGRLGRSPVRRPAPALLPRTESLADVGARLPPYWYDAIVPDLRAGRTVLVTAHGNSLRALAAHLDHLSPRRSWA